MRLVLTCPECGGTEWDRNKDLEGPMFICKNCGCEEDPENMGTKAEE